jgi:hypothetical protein
VNSILDATPGDREDFRLFTLNEFLCPLQSSLLDMHVVE